MNLYDRLLEQIVDYADRRWAWQTLKRKEEHRRDRDRRDAAPHPERASPSPDEVRRPRDPSRGTGATMDYSQIRRFKGEGERLPRQPRDPSKPSRGVK